MPLEVPETQSHFVQIEDIYVDSERDRVSGDNADFVVDLTQQRFSRVIAVEVPEYHIPVDLLSQFTGADRIDFRLRNPSINGGNWKTLVAHLAQEKQLYFTPEELPGCTLSTVFEAFRLAILQDPDFGGKCDVIPRPRTDDRLELVCRTLVFPPFATWPGMGSTECELLFGSGANLSRSAGPVLGFDQQDYPLTPFTFDGKLFRSVIGDRPIQINKYSYVDMFFDEVPELAPVTRMFVPDLPGLEFFDEQPDLSSRTRLLTRPVRDLRKLTVRIRLQGGLKPQKDLPLYFTVRVFYLNLTHSIPYYARNRRIVR